MRKTLTLLAVASLLLACAPTLNWRELVVPEGRFSAVFPGKPQQSVREIPFGSTRMRMSMSAAGQGATLFAVGVAPVPPGAGPELLTQLEQALLANVRMAPASPMLDAPPPPPLSREVQARARAARALRALAPTRVGTAEPTQLVAHLLWVDDRVYQIVALSDAHLAETELETFFGAFKLLP